MGGKIGRARTKVWRPLRGRKRSAETQTAPRLLAGPFFVWVRGQDLNLGPSGYEPDELPDCSTPRHRISAGGPIPNGSAASWIRATSRRARIQKRLRGPIRPVWTRSTPTGRAAHSASGEDADRERRPRFFRSGTCIWLGRPGSDLLSRALRHSTIGAGGLNDRVRNGIGWGTPATTTRSAKPNATTTYPSNYYIVRIFMSAPDH
jgi:hypothetical protein